MRPLPLTLRLALLFTAVAATVVTGLGLFFVVATEQHFIELDEQILRDKQLLISDLVRRAHSQVDLNQQLEQVLQHSQGLAVKIQDVHGDTLFAYQSAVQHLSQHALSHSSVGRSLQFTVTAPLLNSNRLMITATIDTTHHEYFIRQIQHRFLLYGVLATLISGLLGWLAAHHGLAPLRAMKRRAATVSSQQLAERMPQDAVPIEMADLAQELNRMLDRLQTDFRRLSEFSADLAHELRTPISNLLTQTQVTLATPREREIYRDTLSSNSEELQRLARTVSDMLFLAKTQHGVDLPHKEVFFVAPEIQALFDFYEALAAEQAVILQLNGEARLIGDRLMVRRAVNNLLSNALRHTQANGIIRVTIAQQSDQVTLVISNSGKPIEAVHLAHIFDRFYRGTSAHDAAFSDGAGLGLAITKAIVEAHGGQIKVASNTEQTSFSLIFPTPASRLH